MGTKRSRRIAQISGIGQRCEGFGNGQSGVVSASGAAICMHACMRVANVYPGQCVSCMIVSSHAKNGGMRVLVLASKVKSMLSIAWLKAAAKRVLYDVKTYIVQSSLALRLSPTHLAQFRNHPHRHDNNFDRKRSKKIANIFKPFFRHCPIVLSPLGRCENGVRMG